MAQSNRIDTKATLQSCVKSQILLNLPENAEYREEHLTHTFGRPKRAARDVYIPARSEVHDNTPLRLEAAAIIAFPGGGMTVSGLRKERDAGRLVTEMIAGKEYTTLQDIERMREACRGKNKVRGFTQKPNDAMLMEPLRQARSGLSETEHFAAAQAFLLQTLDKPRQQPSKPSVNTSQKSMRRRGTVTVHSPPSQ